VEAAAMNDSAPKRPAGSTGGIPGRGGATAPPGPDPFDSAVARAILHLRGAPAVIRSVAADLPRGERRDWLAMADAIEAGDVAEGLAMAGRNPWPWLPLLAGAERDDVLPARLLDHAVRPRVTAGGRWTMLAYPLLVVGIAIVVVACLSLTVLPIFTQIFDDFGLTLPLTTRLVVGLVGFFSSIWQPVALGLGLAAAGWWVAVRWSPRGAAVMGSFTGALGSLVSWGEEAETARAIAARVVGVGTTRDLPQLPAVAEALASRGAAAGAMLTALADCQADRCRQSLSLIQWLLGPVAVGIVGLIVGLIVLAVFMPLVKLVSGLS
jgi:hypothetical protein